MKDQLWESLRSIGPSLNTCLKHDRFQSFTIFQSSGPSIRKCPWLAIVERAFVRRPRPEENLSLHMVGSSLSKEGTRANLEKCFVWFLCLLFYFPQSQRSFWILGIIVQKDVGPSWIEIYKTNETSCFLFWFMRFACFHVFPFGLS